MRLAYCLMAWLSLPSLGLAQTDQSNPNMSDTDAAETAEASAPTTSAPDTAAPVEPVPTANAATTRVPDTDAAETAEASVPTTSAPDTAAPVEPAPSAVAPTMRAPEDGAPVEPTPTVAATSVLDPFKMPTPPTEHPLLAVDDELFIGVLAIGGWGVSRWKWFRSGFKFRIENGFTLRSSTGGSDKTGHFFAGFVVSDILAWRLRELGYDRTTSALWGAAGSMALMTWIEVGDATSKYGWSFEDLLADFLGVGVSAVLNIFPKLDDLIDFRVQYWPTKAYLSGKNHDLAADYSGMKHLMAFKLSGIPYVRDTPLRYLEAQVGYYSRGFRSFDTVPKSRTIYLGIGVTITEVLKPIVPQIPGVRELSPALLTFFEYYQPPPTTLEAAAFKF